MKKRKIIIVLGGFNFGGTVFSTLNMIMFLREQYDIQVLPMNPCGPVCEKYEEAGIPMLAPPFSLMAVSNASISNEKSLCKKCGMLFHKALNHICIALHIDYTAKVYEWAAKQITNRFQPDYVCSSQEGGSTEFASHFTKAKRVAWFRTEYSIWKNQLTPQTLNHNQVLYRKFDYIVPVSKTTADDFIKYFPDIADRVIPIHNIQKDDNITERANEQIPDYFSTDTFNIVSVGRISRQKQFHKIPAIAYKLHDELGLPIKWYIVGGEGTGAFGEAEKLNTELDKYNNRDYVICVGDKLNPYPYIKLADLLVNTSYYEACPRVVAEAQIIHTPVICADFSSAYEFVQNDVNGYIDNIDNLWQPIARMITDKQTYHRIKSVCDTYKIDNSSILRQLQNLFS